MFDFVVLSPFELLEEARSSSFVYFRGIGISGERHKVYAVIILISHWCGWREAQSYSLVHLIDLNLSLEIGKKCNRIEVCGWNLGLNEISGWSGGG